MTAADDEEGLFRLFVAYRQERNVDEAARTLQRIVRLEGKRKEEALYWLGLTQVENGQLISAAANLDLARVSGPTRWDAYRLFGYVLSMVTHQPKLLPAFTHRYGARDVSNGGILLIKPWSVGFWGEVSHVVSQLAVAEMLGRKPIVLWNQDSPYWVAGTENAWDVYFEPVGDIDLDAVRLANSFCPSGLDGEAALGRSVNSYVTGKRDGILSLAHLRSDAEVIVADGYSDMAELLPWAPRAHRFRTMSIDAVIREIFRTHIRLKPAIQAEIAGMASRFPADMIAVHYRTPADIKTYEAVGNRPLTLDEYWPAIDDALAANPGAAIFLLTDFTPAIPEFRSRYGDRLHMIDDVLRVDDAKQIEITFNQEVARDRLAMDVIRDAYLAARCTAFIGDGASGVSCAITFLKDWPAGTVRLLRDNCFVALRAKRYIA